MPTNGKATMSDIPVSPKKLAALIDHTFLGAAGTVEDIRKLCNEAVEFGFGTVAVYPAELDATVGLLRGKPVRVCAAIGIPFGQDTSPVKEHAIRDAIDRGADEVDMVMNVRALQSRKIELVSKEFITLAKACRNNGVVSKVILETCYLTNEQKDLACALAKYAGLDFVKTSTGMGTGGATVEDIVLMRKRVGPDMGVKASGGIRDVETALAMIGAGANRIGTSSGVAIINSLQSMPQHS